MSRKMGFVFFWRGLSVAWASYKFFPSTGITGIMPSSWAELEG